MHRFSSVFSLLFCGLNVVAVGATYRVSTTFPDGVKVGQENRLRFSLYRGSETTALTASDLKLEHEKLIHLLALDSGFQQYLHEHPEEVSPGIWEVKVNIRVPGDYRFWLQFLPEDETRTKTVRFDQKFLQSPGQSVPNSPVDKSLKLSAKAGNYDVKLSYPDGEPEQHGMTTLRFSVSLNGQEIPVEQWEDYLGAKMHVVGISADKKDFVHSHPGHHHYGLEAQASLDRVQVHFMQSGYYGVFMQFQHAGQLQTAQFGVHVKSHGHGH